MSIEEFLERLQETPRDWHVDNGGSIRRCEVCLECCPISSCNPNGPRDTDDWEEVAWTLGLGSCDYQDIVEAADSEQPDYRTELHALRAQLLEACGLPLETRA